MYRSYENPYTLERELEKARAALAAAGIVCENTPELLIGASGASVARVGMSKYEDGIYVSDSELSPTYLRLPQAERERLEREGAAKQ